MLSLAMLLTFKNPYAPLLLSSLSSPFAPRIVTQFFIMHCLQPTKFRHHISAIRSLKAAMANPLTNHVTAGACRTAAQLRSQCAVDGGEQGSRSRFCPVRQLAPSEDFLLLSQPSSKALLERQPVPFSTGYGRFSQVPRTRR